MGEQPEIHTDRLILRRWTANDLAPFAELNADPRVMEYFPARLSREESDAIAERKTEAARAAVAFGFQRVGLKEIVAFTVPANVRSRRVMEKIGMTHNPADDFDHPRVPEGHFLRRHVLYRIENIMQMKDGSGGHNKQ